MRRIACYLYQEGRDFSLPPVFDSIARHRLEAPEGLVLIEEATGARVANPNVFGAASPEEAEVFLFPYDLGPLINLLQPGPCTAFLAALPFFPGREKRHLFSDDGDIAEPLSLPVWLLKHSLLRSAGGPDVHLPFVYRASAATAPGCIAMPYTVPDWVLGDAPSFDWGALRYDCSFVGGFTNPVRKFICASLEREPGLRFYNGGFESLDMHGGVFTARHFSPEEVARRQELFRRVSKASLMVLCPPGVGPQSQRLYEAMYHGRIPALFTRKARYPLEHCIDYESFCFFIDEDELPEAGPAIKRILRDHAPEDLRERCVLACKTWNAYFRRDKFFARLIEMIRQCLDV
jgi:hypothetical protein